MLEAVLNHVNRHAQILVCGMISQYKKVNHMASTLLMSSYSFSTKMAMYIKVACLFV